MFFLRKILICIFTFFYAYGEGIDASYIVLKEHLSAEKLQVATESLDSNKPYLILVIHSSTGDLKQTLELAKQIYALKTLKNLHVIVYIDDIAVGPAAILPFLADELYTSLSATWGHIPLGNEDTIPINILRNQVEGLITPHQPDMFHLLADAMTDARVEVIDDQGWKIASPENKKEFSLISGAGQTLVVNQNQLQALHLIKGILTESDFDARFKIVQPSFKETAPSPLEQRFAAAIKIDPSTPATIGYIYIGDHESMISQSTWIYVNQALKYYQEHRPLLIILELDTPGGEVFAAQKISDALKEMDTQYNIPVVAYINNWAISAGAMLAYSCRFIAVVKDASMGAAEPVYAGETGKLETASEKVNSALRADFASRARFFDRNSDIAEAMVDKDVILVWRYGQVVKLDNESQIRLTGPNPDVVLSTKGKLLTLNGKQLIDYGVADVLLPPHALNPISAEEKAAGHWPANKMLLFQIPPFNQLQSATVDAYVMDWKTAFFAFLTTPVVSSLLFMGFIIGIYMELNHPGISLPGFIAALCLFLIMLSSFALQLAHWLEVIFVVTGLALLLIEIFVLPSFGLVGIIGGLLFLVGLIGMLIPGLNGFELDTSNWNIAGQYILERLAWLGASLILSLIVIALLAKYVTPRLAAWNRFILVGHEQDASKGYFAGADPSHLPAPGTQGEVLATLRPAGKIIVNGHIYEAITQGGFIDAGEKIEVARLEGGVIIVRKRL